MSKDMQRQGAGCALQQAAQPHAPGPCSRRQRRVLRNQAAHPRGQRPGSSSAFARHELRQHDLRPSATRACR